MLTRRVVFLGAFLIGGRDIYLLVFGFSNALRLFLISWELGSKTIEILDVRMLSSFLSKRERLIFTSSPCWQHIISNATSFEGCQYDFD